MELVGISADLSFDVVELILLGLDVKDIIQCKSVCKSWRTFISSPAFVKAHLKHQNNNTGGHRRIRFLDNTSNDELCFYMCNDRFIVGSCNGLVCVSTKGAEFELVNPCTKEIKKLQTASFYKRDEIEERFVGIRLVLIMSFGYDASTDDYKVVAGFTKRPIDERTYFYVLELKANVWKFIGEVYYGMFRNYVGTFCGGALHWFMRAANKKVIMYVDLSTDECKEIPQPTANLGYESENLSDHNLGVIEGCLCVYSSMKSKKIWVMKKNKWELYNNYINKCKYDIAHCLSCVSVVDSQNRRTGCRDVYVIDDGRPVPNTALSNLRASTFVKSLVAPQVKELQPEANKVNIRKGRNKRKNRSCKQKRVFF